MERKTTQRWQLQDVLHAAGEDGITETDYGDHGGDVMQAKIEPIEARLELTALDLACDDESKSYSLLPEKCIINGAILIKCRGTYWAIQSPREEFVYARNQLVFQN
jgi:hypothetical protein